jgi:Na+/H+-dicarboxylate symporter
MANSGPASSGVAMKLHAKILIGLAAGAGAGATAAGLDLMWLRRALLTLEPVGTVFVQLIMMVVIPLVIANLFVAMASFGEGRRLARLGVRTIAYFLATTVIGAVIGLLLALALTPGAGFDPAVRDQLAAQFEEGAGRAAANASSTPGLSRLLLSLVPQNPIGAAARMDLLPVVIAGLIFGIAASRIAPERRRVMVGFFEGLNEICMVIIRWVMNLAPYAVFALIGSTVARFGGGVLRQLFFYCLVVVAGLLIHTLVVLSISLRLLARMKVIDFYRGVAKALLVAFSTASSNATLPVSIEAAERNLGIPPRVAGFVLPLGATLNLNGGAIYKSLTAVFIAQVYGLSLGLPAYGTIVTASTLAALAGVGVPGSSLVTTLIVLNTLGLGANAVSGIALVLGVDPLLDMMRTTVNVTGSLTCAAYVGRFEREA